MLHGTRNKRALIVGFTLVELIITIFVFAIIAGLAGPSFRTLIVGQRVRNASFDLSSAIFYARNEAAKRNANVTIERLGSNWHSGWEVKVGTDVLLRQDAYTNVVISESTYSSVVFNRAGRIANLAAAPPSFAITNDTSPATVTRCVRVDSAGRVNTAC